MTPSDDLRTGLSAALVSARREGWLAALGACRDLVIGWDQIAGVHECGRLLAFIDRLKAGGDIAAPLDSLSRSVGEAWVSWAERNPVEDKAHGV